MAKVEQETENASRESAPQVFKLVWIRYSNGHFGFSVQKQAYVETGNPLDGKYDKEAFNR